MSPRDLADLKDAANSLAHLAGVDVKTLSDHRDTDMVAAVFSRVWGSNATHVPTELGMAFIESGNYVAGAFSGDTMVGATVAFLGRHDGAIHLHSHITGVLTEFRGRRIGTALKLHQAVWATQRNIERISWSFDPLIRHNAHFNINKLGAKPVAYRENLYGPLEDQFSAKEESDRVLVDWYPTRPEARAAWAGTLLTPNAEALAVKGASLLLRDHDGPAVLPGSADVLCVQIPKDVVALRNATPQIGSAWRDALRDTLEAAMNRGYRITGFDPAGSYILERTSA